MAIKLLVKSDLLPVPGRTDPYSYTNKPDSAIDKLTDLTLIGVPAKYQAGLPFQDAYPRSFSKLARPIWNEMLQGEDYKAQVKSWGTINEIWANTIQNFMNDCETLGVDPIDLNMEVSENEAFKDAVRYARILLVQYADEAKLFERVKVRKAFREYVRNDNGMTLISWADLYPMDTDVADGFEKWLTTSPMPRMYKMTNNRYVKFVRPPRIRMWVRFLNRYRVRIGFEIDIDGHVRVPGDPLATRLEVDDFIDRTIYFPLIKAHRFENVRTRIF
jgi:hypothetical protein